MKVITTHKNPDFDAISSCIAAKKLYPDAKIVFPDLPKRSTKSFMIQSIIYQYVDLEDNIDFHKIDTLIIVDTHSKQRIEEKFYPILDSAYIICYDHHEKGDIKCNEFYSVNFGANVTQMVLKILDKNIEIDDAESTLFMIGIYEDTGKLLYNSTTPEDFFVCSKLLERNADLETVKSVVEQNISETEVSILNELLKNKRVYEINSKKAALSFVSREEYIGNVASLVTEILEIDDVDVAVGIFRMASRIYIIGRSKDKDINIASVLKKMGGGGHPQAASAIIKDMTLIEVAEKMSYYIRNALLDSVTAKDIMSFPPKFVYSDDTLQSVNDTILKSGMNALVVLDKKSMDVVGIITRQTLNKAMFHNMQNEEISFFMSTEFSVVDKDEKFENIKKIISEDKQRLVPVLDDGKLTGVITRTNLLKIVSDGLDKSSLLHIHNVEKGLEKTLPVYILNYLKKAGNIAKELGYNAYIVGGVVRDMVLGYENLDIDIVIEGDGVKFARRFAKEYSARVAVHEVFKTATVIFKNGLKIDVATAREEYYKLPGALPTVEQSSIQLDLYRRDFTINTLAIKLNNRFGELLDFFGGLKDIKEKKIRVLHMLSFVEDPTRMFRAVRFSARFGFEIGQQTDRLIKSAIKLDILSKVDRGRIFHEIVLIMNSKCVKCSFEMIGKYRLIHSLNKNMMIDKRILNYIEKCEYIISNCDFLCKAQKIKKEMVFIIMLEYLFRKNLSFSKEIGADDKTCRISKELSYEFKNITNMLNSSHSNAEIYKILNSIPIEGVLSLYALNNKNDKIKIYLNTLLHKKPIIRGKDLIELGFKPSKIFSVIINDVFENQLNNKINSKYEALEFVKNKYKN